MNMAKKQNADTSTKTNRIPCLKATLTILLVATGLWYYFGVRVKIEFYSEKARVILTPTCNFTAFQEQLSLDAWTPVVPFHLLANCTHVFYNRHQKTGSRTMLEIIKVMGSKHRFALVAGILRLDPTWSFLPEKYLGYALNKMKSAKGRFAFVIHMLYYDFRSHLNFKDTQIYLNIIREPAPWFVSWFNWAKINTKGPTGQRFNPHGEKRTLEECIRNVTCSYDERGNAIHYLCGHEKICERHTEAALEQATQRLHHDYLSVGPMERQEEVLELWEYLLPQIFSGAVAQYRKQGKQMKEKFGQNKREIPSNETYSLLKSNLELDYKLYERVSDRFQRMLDVVKLLKGIHPEGYNRAWANHYRTVIKRYFSPPT